jgi:hypothetical protein
MRALRNGAGGTDRLSSHGVRGCPTVAGMHEFSRSGSARGRSRLDNGHTRMVAIMLSTQEGTAVQGPVRGPVNLLLLHGSVRGIVRSGNPDNALRV